MLQGARLTRDGNRRVARGRGAVRVKGEVLSRLVCSHPPEVRNNVIVGGRPYFAV